MNKTIKIIILIIVIIESCYADAEKKDEEISEALVTKADTNAAKIVLRRKDTDKAMSVDEPILKDNSVIKKTGKKTNRHLNEHDKQYIDLIIPDYAEIILIHENKKETIKYAGELRKYFLSKKADIRKQPVFEEPQETRDKRFYIKSVGDNLYIIHVYDDYLPGV